MKKSVNTATVKEARDITERRQLLHILVERYGAGLAQGLLDQVVEIAEPIVDFDVKFDPSPGREQDQRRAWKRPG